jgi:tRNA(Ile)-lysidine synthase
MLKPKVRQAIETLGFVRPGDVIVAGVSGGPDSVALVHALDSLRSHFGYSLHVAHLNHRLRGRESDQDALFVRHLADRLGLPVTVQARDVPALRRQRKLGLEEAARVARYQFFAELISRLGACCVAVAHTADDQVETVVQHWLRGAALAGLSGMRSMSIQRLGEAWKDGGPGEVRVARPMLTVTRREVEAYVESHALPTRVDASNLDLRYQRNRVRLELLPFLERYNPNFRQAALRSASIAAQDYEYVQSQVLAAWSDVATVEGQTVVIDLDGWLRLPPSLQYYALRYAAIVLLGDAMDISSANIVAAVETMRDKPVGATVIWPRQIRVVKGYRDFRMRLGEPAARQAIAGVNRLTIPGRTAAPGTSWEVIGNIVGQRCAQQGNDPWHADLDFDVTGPELYVRKRRPGDAFVPLGMAGTKKLQDFLVDEKVPADERDAVPIVVSPAQIVWVAGHRIDERAKVTADTTRVLCLTFEKVA